MGKNKTAQIGAVIKGILFIGFSIQIILGIVWMCCNFAHVQDFPVPDTTLYGGLFRLLGGCAPLMYLLQLAAAFCGGYFFIQSVAPVGKWTAVWRTLALLTFPFAMQCHLAVQPHSLAGTLFLMVLAFIVRGFKGKRHWWLGILCAVLLIGITGVADGDSREDLENKGLLGILAGRMSWTTLVNDLPFWSDELQEIAADVSAEAGMYPDNMDILLNAIQNAVGKEKAREYYKEIIESGWERRRSTIVREMCWDVLGYTFTPIGVGLMLDGEAYYDSYTGRNYENMRSAFPLLTRHYVDYVGWWFAVALVLGVAGSVVLLVQWRLTKTGAESMGTKELRSEKKMWHKNILAVVVCVGLALIWVTALTLRGAGVMDYKWTIAVNQLWIVWELLVMESMRKV